MSQPNFQSVAPQQQSSLEDTLKVIMAKIEKNDAKIENSTHLHAQAIAKLENQMGQMAERENGKFPSQPIPNPKGQFAFSNPSNSTYKHEQVQSIVTLRSGKQVDNQVSMQIEKSLGELEKEERQSNPTKDQESSSPQPPKEPQLRSFIPKAPYPERLVAPKKGVDHGDILEVFKQVRINVPFLDAIRQVLSYAKFLKDLVSIKRKASTPKEVVLTEQVSSIIQHKVPVKYKDLGCPTISCTIGNHHIERALLDLGASVNLLSYSVYLQLGLGELKPTSIRLQLADGFVKIPKGVIEDILIKVDKFYFPVDLIVLDTQPVQNSKGHIPVILGRPFLATFNAQINCRNGVMKMSFGNMTVDLNIFYIDKQSSCEDEVSAVYMIDSHVKEQSPSSYEDPFEACLSHFNNIDEDSMIESVNMFLESFIDISRWNLCFVEPPFLENTPSLRDEQESNFELKPLPPDSSVEIMGPTEFMSVVGIPNTDQIEEEKIADENDHCNKKLECNFVIGKEPLHPTGRTLLAILLFKNSFPWYADYVFHLNKVDIVTNFAK
ncbi:uncharacterized protein LOC131323713 [Rhododendron vialii]|uniref:uncharacterized protein LOC131323713 n=1 Tax=Rhododendron vialii TaxID=182163 RepID=UPI00265E9DFB|nr:uncharacterized protein LOC131323713 [Rhododendron vialii]